VSVARRELELQPITDAWAVFVRAVHKGEPATAALTAFCERVGLSERESVLEAYALATAVPAPRAAPEPSDARALATACTAEIARLAPILAVLRALPVGATQDWWLAKVIAEVFARPELNDLLPLILKDHPDRQLVESARAFLLVNRHQDVDWFNAERMAVLLQGQALSRWVALLTGKDTGEAEARAALLAQEQLEKAVHEAAYKLADLLDSLPATAEPPAADAPVAKKEDPES
jgi:hypothetical protein